MTKSKILSYIGFAIKAGECRIGVNAIYTIKRAKLLILCGTAAKNTVKEAIKLSKRFNCDIVVAKTVTVEEITGKEHCKLMAITDASLAKAIKENLDGNFIRFQMEAE